MLIVSEKKKKFCLALLPLFNFYKRLVDPRQGREWMTQTVLLWLKPETKIDLHLLQLS